MFKLKIKMDNEAFSDAELECARILRKVADQLEGHIGRVSAEGAIMDINGNRVGAWMFAK